MHVQTSPYSLNNGIVRSNEIPIATIIGLHSQIFYIDHIIYAAVIYNITYQQEFLVDALMVTD